MSKLKFAVEFVLRGDNGSYDIRNFIECQNLLKAVKVAYHIIKQQGYDHVYIKIYRF